MATIKRVAARAGVSFTTVSHVLNGTRRVSDSARDRVERAVAEMGYAPSAVARSTVGHPIRAMGETAAGVLIERIATSRAGAREVVLPARLLLRESTGPAPVH